MAKSMKTGEDERRLREEIEPLESNSEPLERISLAERLDQLWHDQAWED